VYAPAPYNRLMPPVIESDVSLQPYNTFGVAARAAHFVRIRSAAELAELLADARWRSAPRLVLGGGSNVLITRDFDGLVMLMAIPGIDVLGEDGEVARVRVGAGEDWHRTVERLLAQGLPGLENLALIPGSAGAAPIQNIGAYGVELAERFESAEVWDTATGEHATLAAEACRFGYRDSVFKHEPGRYIVLAITLALPRAWRPVAGYAELAAELRTRGIEQSQPRDVFDAVVAIRRRKLPDPAVIGNAGSFFKNPIVPRAQRDALRDRYPSLVSYDIGGGRCKLAAGWLIETAGLKGAARGAAAVYEKQALVLVNRGGATGAEILALSQEVQQRVQRQFGVALEPEPAFI